MYSSRLACQAGNIEIGIGNKMKKFSNLTGNSSNMNGIFVVKLMSANRDPHF